MKLFSSFLFINLLNFSIIIAGNASRKNGRKNGGEEKVGDVGYKKFWMEVDEDEINLLKEATGIQIFEWKSDGIGKSKKGEKVAKRKSTRLLMKAKTTLLAKSPDNAIYQAQRIDEIIAKEYVVIKIVEFQKKGERDRKPFDALAHEVEMLKLAKANQCNFVVKLFEAHILNGKIYMVIEMGEWDLEEEIKGLEKNWEAWEDDDTEDEGEEDDDDVMMIGEMKKKDKMALNDMNRLVIKMATTLDDIHRIGMAHLALKPNNWLYVNRELKLIDLQTALAFNPDGSIRIKNEKEKKYWNFACKLPDKKKDSSEHYRAPLPNYASPEHKKFCSSITADGQNVNPSQLTTKMDIWSLGVLICEILAKTPIIAEGTEEWKWNGLEKFEIMAKAFGDPAFKEEAKELASDIVEFVRKNFAHIFVVLEKIFQLNHQLRPSASLIQHYFIKISNIGHLELLKDERKMRRMFWITEKILSWKERAKKCINNICSKVFPQNVATEPQEKIDIVLVKLEKKADLIVEKVENEIEINGWERKVKSNI